MFVNGVLYNSEFWQGLRTADITILEVVDHQLMRLICDGHSKTPIEFYYLETASLQLKSILSSRRIMYLHHILGRNEGELIKRVFEAQRDNTTPGDFVDLVKADLSNIGEIFEEDKIKLKGKNIFKTHIKNKIKAKTFEDLKSQQ